MILQHETKLSVRSPSVIVMLPVEWGHGSENSTGGGAIGQVPASAMRGDGRSDQASERGGPQGLQFIGHFLVATWLGEIGLSWPKRGTSSRVILAVRVREFDLWSLDGSHYGCLVGNPSKHISCRLCISLVKKVCPLEFS